MSEILVVGSVAYDTIATPAGRVENALGGSANYFAVAASLFCPIRVVGVVGDDYKASDLSLLTERGVDVAGLQRVPGDTFRWSGRYEGDMNEAITLATHLNVFQDFSPELPGDYRKSSVVFLANIDPVLQLKVLDQVQGPRLVGADTMNFWIDKKPKDLRKVLERIDVLLINEGKLRRLTGDWNTISAVREVASWGPKAVVIKRGEYGFVMFAGQEFFILPAFPVSKVVDPTGAGDTFAGGFLGYLARQGADLTVENLRRACVYGCLLASFTVEDFSLGALKKIGWSELENRHSEYYRVISYPPKV